VTNPGDARLAHHRFHLIEAGRFTGALAPESKAKPDLELLTYLFGAGRGETEKWLARNRGSIGRRATVDLGRHFLAGRGEAPAAGAGTKPVPEVAA
jgi:NTE family protein